VHRGIHIARSFIDSRIQQSYLSGQKKKMSDKYWRDRWIDSLVHNGLDRKTAEAAFEEAYKNRPADESKSPETQALMTYGLGIEVLPFGEVKVGTIH